MLSITIRDLYDGSFFYVTCSLPLLELRCRSSSNKTCLARRPSKKKLSPKIAGAYPGVTASTYLSLTSEPPAELGQWSYDFSDPNGPQLGTVALPGMTSVYETEDPVVIIAENTSLGVSLPPPIVDPVDLIVLCDRSKRYFSERKFLVLDLEGKGGELKIAAFGSKQEVPGDATILGQVTFVQIPWLPNMQKKKSGFMEEDELF